MYRNCGGKLQKQTLNFKDYQEDIGQNFNSYQSFESLPSKLPNIDCMTGEPEFLNPNGYNNIVQVLQSIGLRSGIKQYGEEEREWLFVECDGLPFNLIRDINSQILKCSFCHKCFWGDVSFEDHTCFIVRNVSPVREFGCLVPIFGLLHI